MPGRDKFDNDPDPDAESGRDEFSNTAEMQNNNVDLTEEDED